MDAETARSRAWKEAGIDAGTAARLGRENARLRPSAHRPVVQRAAAVVDLAERARVMRGIAASYGRIYAAAPGMLLWAGFAAIAVNDGVRPTTEVALTTAAVANAVGGATATIGAIAEDGIKCAFETNYAIYADLAWVHLAFVGGGAAALRGLRRDGEIDEALLGGFEDIERGARTGGAVGEELVLRGNLALFHHEQRASVTPIFERYREAMDFATRAGLVRIPNRTLAARCAALGRSPQWRDEESYRPFSPRWRWLVRHAWEPLVALHRERGANGRRSLDAEVARAVAGLPEEGTLSRIVRRRRSPRTRETTFSSLATIPPGSSRCAPEGV
jgi:hypothetical protein